VNIIKDKLALLFTRDT